MKIYKYSWQHENICLKHHVVEIKGDRQGFRDLVAQ